MPIATSHWPWRHARPNESAITTAGAAGQRGAQRAGAGVGVARQRHDAVRRRRRSRRRRRRWRRRSRGACGRSARRARRAGSPRSRRARPARRAGPCRARRRTKRARAVGRDVAQLDDGALGLRDDLVRDARARRPRRSRRAARAAAAISGARSSPGAISGRPSSASASTRLIALTGGACRALTRRARGSAPRVCAAPSARPRGARRARRGRRRCRRRAAARAPRRRGPRRRPRAPGARGARGCPGRSSASITSGGVSSSAFVPVPWRSGTITTSGPSASMSASRRRSRRWSIAGVSPASSSAWNAPSSSAQRDADRGGLGVARRPGPRRSPGCRSRARAPRPAGRR